MDADFSIELGSDDPVLDFPWTDASGRLKYVDLKQHPELIPEIPETAQNLELAEFLRSINSDRRPFQSAKCDTWTTAELAPEEEIFGASHKFASYVDIVFSDAADCLAFSRHEEFVKRLATLLRRSPEISASVEICVRRCFFVTGAQTSEGFYFTVYVNGFGNDEPSARRNWAIGMKLVENALVQLSRSG